MATNFQTYK